MPRRLTTAEFIEKAKGVHGDRYNYSQTEYANIRTKVTVICPDHGPFDQLPNAHLKGHNCPSCGYANRRSLRDTAEEFIKKAKAVHGDRYDYSRVAYVNNHTPVKIICQRHGPFAQIPSSHIRKHGCPTCGSNKLTTEIFIEKAKEIHGNRYDYSAVKYTKSNRKVAIVCPLHGAFEQTPNSHLSKKAGCMECGGRKQLDTRGFIEKAREIHGDRYDYSAVQYMNNRENVTIICPDHGPFFQVPSNHLSKNRTVGCPDCAGKNVTTDKFVAKAIAVHGQRYDYSLTNYTTAKDEVVVICPEHGPYQQAATDHLAGKGCRECAGNVQLTTAQFIEKAKQVHGGHYDYTRVEYINTGTKVMILCPEHGPFEQTPTDHIHQKSGCSGCAETGFNPSESGMLYYLAISTDDGDTRYKIGITNNSVDKRFRAPDLARIRVVRTWRYAVGLEAARREAEILRQFAGDKYTGVPILQSGNTELFTHDVLGLDK